jgi:argininosuccinate synthase
LSYLIRAIFGWKSNIKHRTSLKIVLAYSGGLDTSVILAWLKQNYDAEIIAFCADIGQERELDGLNGKSAPYWCGQMHH